MPDNAELHFGRACLLERRGRPDEAKQEYLAVLQLDPSHFGAINNLGTMLFEIGLCRYAAVLYAQAVRYRPRNVMGYINLAGAYFELGEYAAARETYEAALRMDPDRQIIHNGLGNALSRLGQEEAAARHFARAFEDRPVLEETPSGATRPIRVLTLFDASIGNVRTLQLVDRNTMQETKLAAWFFDAAKTLPPHDVLLNAIGDADRCAPALERACQLAAKTAAPVFNHPARVLATGRANVGRYRVVDGVVAPNTSLVPRAHLCDARAAAVLAAEGFAFPLLLRTPGYHAGEHLELVESLAELNDTAHRLPGEYLLLIEYLDARDPEGAFRKYRVIIVGQRIFPLHLAISQHWKVHYFSAAMAESEKHRREDAAFLNDMPEAIGIPAVRALEGIARMMGLEFAGIDFALDRVGRVLLFEANAAMMVALPEPGARWNYRRPHVARILDAMRNLIPALLDTKCN